MAEAGPFAVGSTYRLFPSGRDHIFAALLELYRDKFAQELGAPPWMVTPTLDRIAGDTLRLHALRPRLVSHLGFVEEWSPMLSGRGPRSLLLSALQDFVARGASVRAFDPDLSAQFLVSIVWGMASVAARVEAQRSNRGKEQTLVPLRAYLSASNYNTRDTVRSDWRPTE